MSGQRPDTPRIELKELTKEYWQGFQDGQVSMRRIMLAQRELEKEKRDESVHNSDDMPKV